MALTLTCTYPSLITSYYSAPCPTAPSLKSLKKSSVNPHILGPWCYDTVERLLITLTLLISVCSQYEEYE